MHCLFFRASYESWICKMCVNIDDISNITVFSLWSFYSNIVWVFITYTAVPTLKLLPICFGQDAEYYYEYDCVICVSLKISVIWCFIQIKSKII